MSTPSVDGLVEVARVLREWQLDDAPVQLHPGDIGWHWRFGAEATALAIRIWTCDGDIRSVGLVDSGVLRLAIAPEAEDDPDLCRQMLADVSDQERGIFGRDKACIEARTGALLRMELLAAGWTEDAPWTPLRLELAEAVPEAGLRIDVTGPEQAPARVAVQRAAFDNSTFTAERWHTMVRGPAYRDARCLVARDSQNLAVAAATVWSAGPGRPGLLEPVGVHREHRRRGYGRAITLAAAAALRELGASSAVVCTSSANVAAVATYTAAGFRPDPVVPDLCRRRR